MSEDVPERDPDRTRLEQKILSHAHAGLPLAHAAELQWTNLRRQSA
jgi:hypothetical protein